jgi:hypothetical protein
MPPSPSTQETYLGQVAAVGTAGAWAVGSSGGADLIERFLGGAWTIVSGVSGVSFLHGLLAFGPRDAYASGSANGEPVVENWDGTSWAQMATPSVPPGNNGLWDLDGLSDGDLWGVGDEGDGSGGLQTLAEHYC